MGRKWLIALLLITALGGCGTPTEALTPPPELITERITFAGSTSFQPLAGRLGEAFQAEYPGIVLDIAAGGTAVGIKAIQDGTVDIGMSARPLKPEETPNLIQHQIAMDVIAIIVHPSNPITGLTRTQLRDIYNGRITRWNELGGPDLPINAVLRSSNSGTWEMFNNLVLEGQAPSPALPIIGITAGDVAAQVSRNSGAIGYVGFGNLAGKIKPLAIDGALPTAENARRGTYPFIRPLLLLTGPLTQPLAEDFIEFALRMEGQKIVESSGWIPIAPVNTRP